MDIEHIPLHVSILLGESDLTLSAYHSLQVGDTLTLPQPLRNRLSVRVQGTDYFLATAGLFGTHKAVVIDERIHP